MDGSDIKPLRIGDWVRCKGYIGAGRGVVVEQVGPENVRVLWTDSPVPTLHRGRILCRTWHWFWEAKQDSCTTT